MKTRKCIVCNKVKSVIHFHKNNFVPSGLQNRCKPCAKIMRLDYRRSLNGLFSAIYSTQKYASKIRNMPPPSYSKKELQKWIMSQSKFNQIYSSWVASGYKRDLKPSVDRKDDYKGYCFDNIQLMIWKENREKLFFDKINGINNKQSHPIVKLNMDNGFICNYPSISSAHRDTRASMGNIYSCCIKKRNKTGGFKWMYAEDYYAV